MGRKDEATLLRSAREALERLGTAGVIFRLEGESLVADGPPGRLGLRLAPGERLPLAALPGLAAQRGRRQTAGVQLHAGALGLAAPLAAVPIPVESGWYGVVIAKDADVAALARFCDCLGAALDNARAHERAARQLQLLTETQDRRVAEERAAALGDAASVLAHELRNPLGAILNAVMLLKRGGGKVDADELLVMIEEEARRIDDLVGDLLELGRPLEPRPRPLELGPLVQRAVDSVLEVAADRRIEVGVTEAAQVRVDPHLVQLAVSNLLRNAVQASPPAGRVGVGVRLEAGWAIVAVEDEGAGVPDEKLIFEPFYTTRQNGSGLGLALVKRVAEVHGGTVSARCREAGGSRFELRLPLDGGG